MIYVLYYSHSLDSLLVQQFNSSAVQWVHLPYEALIGMKGGCLLPTADNHLHIHSFIVALSHSIIIKFYLAALNCFRKRKSFSVNKRMSLI